VTSSLDTQRDGFARLAEDHVALRRLMVLLERATPPEELFTAVADWAGHLLPFDVAYLGRYEPDGTLTFIAAWSKGGDHPPVDGRIDGHGGAPIIVDDRVWGVICGPIPESPVPGAVEARLTPFAEILASALGTAVRRVGLARLTDEHAALRRVATLVARTATPEEVFSAVTEEVGRLLPADVASLARYESDGTATIIADWSESGDHIPVGTRLALGGRNLISVVSETCGPARIDTYADASGPVGAAAREVGTRSAVGTPIVVEGHLWGVMIAGSTGDRSLPAETETRLVSFTDLLATAIANAESRADLTRLAEEQAALLRVATLVAQGVPAEELFAAVTEEVGGLLPVDGATMGRYESDRTVTFVHSWSTEGSYFPVPSRWDLGGKNVPTVVADTGRPARLTISADFSGPIGLAARERGRRASVGTPIVVEGRVWGVMLVRSDCERDLPPHTEARLTRFTDLVATAIANAESRAELAASRARIVTAADETRRRIERDLHDGAQQRLVSLGLALRTTQAAVPPELGQLDRELSLIATGLANVQDELREIARGIHPAILAEGGLGPALKTLARRCPIPVELDVREHARLPERHEVAAYYVVAETLTNAAKHAQASVVHVAVEVRNSALDVSIRDDGAGGADPTRGSGLLGLKDRVESLGGTIAVQSRPGAGTSVHVELPLED
jgi:signal transduction histidine kinase